MFVGQDYVSKYEITEKGRKFMPIIRIKSRKKTFLTCFLRPVCEVEKNRT